MAESADNQDKKPERAYELAYSVSSRVSEDKLGDVVMRLKNILEKQGVFVTFDEFPRFRQLAYALTKSLGGKNEKYSNAYFGWMRFETNATALAEINAGFERDADIVRFLIVKTDRDYKTSIHTPPRRREMPKRDAIKANVVKAPSMTEAEIDKTIEELIAEQNP